MREILFKAKRKNWRELPEEEWWVEGCFVKGIWYLDEKEIYAIIPADAYLFPYNEISELVEIDPETLCQFTGLTDKNSKRIWENDIIKHTISDTLGKVKWYQENYVGWCVDDIMIDEQQFTDEMWSECEVIGCIF